MTLSEDLRKRVIDFVRAGGSKSQAAKRFNISRSSVYNWLGLKTLAIKTTRNVIPYKLDPEKLKAHVEQYPDAYQHERAKDLGVSNYVVWYGLKRLGIKKKPVIRREKRQLSQFVQKNTKHHSI